MILPNFGQFRAIFGPKLVFSAFLHSPMFQPNFGKFLDQKWNLHSGLDHFHLMAMLYELFCIPWTGREWWTVSITKSPKWEEKFQFILNEFSILYNVIGTLEPKKNHQTSAFFCRNIGLSHLAEILRNSDSIGLYSCEGKDAIAGNAQCKVDVEYDQIHW